ncbi:MAG: hypothetical protein ACAI25_03530, partial [Planctomycetota bacterium]
ALSRWKLVATGLPIFDHSYYQYLPAFAWTVPFAAVVAALAARHGPRVYAVAALAIVVLGVAHGREAALDRTPFSPARRRELQHPEVVARIAEVVASTRGPVFDARVSRFLAWSEVRVHDVVAIAAPGVAGVYTTTLSAETFAPFERDPLLTHNVLPR